jgi:hypothetical protein
LPPSQGYEYNCRTAYVPFNILNEQGVEAPAQYVKVHLEVPNPFAEACMSMQGPVYCTEWIRIIGDDYCYRAVVDKAVDRIGDRSLKAEVQWYRGLKVQNVSLQEQIRHIEDRLYTVQMDQQANWDRLQDTRVWERVNKEVRRDQRIHPLTPWSVECGRSS